MRNSAAFRLRVRAALMEHIVDAALFTQQQTGGRPEALASLLACVDGVFVALCLIHSLVVQSASSGEMFLVFASDDPVPIVAPQVDLDKSVDERYYSLEIDHADWEQRHEIVKQYAAQVRQRVRVACVGEVLCMFVRSWLKSEQIQELDGVPDAPVPLANADVSNGGGSGGGGGAVQNKRALLNNSYSHMDELLDLPMLGALIVVHARTCVRVCE